MKYVSDVLKFLNLADKDGNLSLTNAVLLTVAVKLAINPVLTLPEIIGFAIAALNYGHKRHEMTSYAKENLAVENALDPTEIIESLQIIQETLRATEEKVTDANDKLGHMSLSQGITRNK